MESILAMDIGGGTQDILLWRRGQVFENSVKLVLPSPTRVMAARIRKAREQRRPVHLAGWLMGGGPIGRAVSEHLEAGLRVSATARAAATLADDLARVREMGVEIQDKPPAGALEITCGDLDLEGLQRLFDRFQVPAPQGMVVAACDHGYSPGFSNRRFRFQMWERFLAGGGALADLISQEPDASLTRLREIQAQAPGALVMDTAAAALWGALQDPQVARRADEGLCIVNLGNMHTVGFLLRGQRVLGVYEHHTRLLDSAALADQVQRFIAGELSNQEVFQARGHGCARLEEAPREVAGPVVITGPRRRLAQGLGWYTANPFGDVMLSGCFGLLAAAAKYWGLEPPEN